MSYEYEYAANLPIEDKTFWYNKAKTCPTLPDDRYYDIRDNRSETYYDIGDNADWPVYKRAVSQAETWSEDNLVKRIVVRCSYTYFILTELSYKSLTSKNRH
jgi:hypothetical protein